MTYLKFAMAPASGALLLSAPARAGHRRRRRALAPRRGEQEAAGGVGPVPPTCTSVGERASAPRPTSAKTTNPSPPTNRTQRNPTQPSATTDTWQSLCGERRRLCPPCPPSRGDPVCAPRTGSGGQVLPLHLRGDKSTQQC